MLPFHQWQKSGLVLDSYRLDTRILYRRIYEMKAMIEA